LRAGDGLQQGAGDHGGAHQLVEHRCLLDVGSRRRIENGAAIGEGMLRWLGFQL